MLRPLLLSLCLVLPRAALAETPRVVTDIGPVESLVAQVMQGIGAPDRLLAPGASPHEMALRPSQARALAEADVVVWIGPALTPGLADRIGTLAPAARSLPLQDIPGTHHLAARETGLFEHAHDAHEAHEDDHHHDESIDPHLWLDPENAALWLTAITGLLAESDPENAAAYQANAIAARTEIRQAQDEATRLLADLQSRPLAAAHDAFQYFEARFGLRLTGALSDSAATPSGPARLAALRDALAKTPPACVLTEPGTDPRLLQAIAGDVPVAELDALGLALPQGAALYPALIRDFARRIAGCVAD